MCRRLPVYQGLLKKARAFDRVGAFYKDQFNPPVFTRNFFSRTVQTVDFDVAVAVLVL